MIEKVTDNIDRIYFPGVHTCNAYLIKDKKILVDTGVMSLHDAFSKNLSLFPEEIDRIFFTHLHYDHVGCFDLFYNAKLYASKDAIDSFHDDPGGSVYDVETIKHLQKKMFTLLAYPPELEEENFTIIETPGHAQGSVCILYNDNGTKIMFSGDLFFDTNFEVVGRTDLPTSSHEKLMVSLRKIQKYDYDILCPGHGGVTLT